MANKAFKKEGVFYVHGIRKWVYRIRDKWGRLKTSQGFPSHSAAETEFNSVR